MTANEWYLELGDEPMTIEEIQAILDDGIAHGEAKWRRQGMLEAAEIAGLIAGEYPSLVQSSILKHAAKLFPKEPDNEP